MSHFSGMIVWNLSLSTHRHLWNMRWTCVSSYVRTFLNAVHAPPKCRAHHWPHCQQAIISKFWGKPASQSTRQEYDRHVWLHSTRPHTLTFRRWAVRISTRTPAMATELYRGFPQSLQANSRILSQLCHDGFLPDLFQIIHQLSYDRSCIA
jgi:hypothetical protein